MVWKFRNCLVITSENVFENTQFPTEFELFIIFLVIFSPEALNCVKNVEILVKNGERLMKICHFSNFDIFWKGVKIQSFLCLRRDFARRYGVSGGCGGRPLRLLSSINQYAV